MTVKVLDIPLLSLVNTASVKIIVNLCDCFNNICSKTSLDIRGTFPGSYAAQLLRQKGDRHKLGTIDHSYEKNCLIFNAYINYDFNDVSLGKEIFDPTMLISCFMQMQDIIDWYSLGDFDICFTYNNFLKFNMLLTDVTAVLTYMDHYVTNDIMLLV